MTESTPLLTAHHNVPHSTYTPSITSLQSNGEPLPPKGTGRGEVNLNNQEELELPEDWVKLKDCNVFKTVYVDFLRYAGEERREEKGGK